MGTREMTPDPPTHTPVQEGIRLNPSFQMGKLSFVQNLQPGSCKVGTAGVRLMPEGFFFAPPPPHTHIKAEVEELPSVLQGSTGQSF